MNRSVAALLLALLATPAAAHTRGASYSDWQMTAGGAEVTVRVSQLDLTRARLHPAQAGYAQAVAALLRADLQLVTPAGRCAPGEVRLEAARDGWLLARWALDCPGAAQGTERAIRSRLFHAVAPSHLHYVRARLIDGAVTERVLTHADPAIGLGAPPRLAASVARYVALGVQHILSGWDHVAFVLALVLLATRLGEVALLATGFTVAHSLTLALAVLGEPGFAGDAVEAVIGFSIALVAIENLWLRSGRDRATPWLLAGVLAALAALGATRLPPLLLGSLALFSACYFALLDVSARPLRLRVAVAFAFGLVHGLGFAGALGPLDLPPGRLLPALLGFNLGVEVGQLAIVAVAWLVLGALSRRPAARRVGVDVASACICALGTFWFMLRAF